MDTILAQLRADPLTNSAIVGIVALAVLDFATGTVRALADGSFTWQAVDVWVRKQLLGRVLTIVLVLGFGRLVGTLDVGDVHLNVLTGAGLVAAATYAAATLASITANLNSAVTHPVPGE